MASSSKRGPSRNSPRSPGSPKSRSGPSALGKGKRPSPGGFTSRAREKFTKARRGPQFTTRAVILLSVVLLLIASYTSSLHAWWGQHGEIQTTKAEIVMRKDAIAELKNDKTRWSDKSFVQQQARARFGWVMPGEVGYRVIGDDGKVQGDVPTLSAPPAPKTKQWYDKLWGTVVESGEKPKQRAPAPDPNEVLKK